MAVIPTGTLFKTLTFDNINSSSYGVYIAGEAVYNAPERVVEMVAIPGRNGTLALDQGRFENIEVTYPAGMFSDSAADFIANIANFRNAIGSKIGYYKLTDDYNVGEFRLAVYKSGLNVSPSALKAGQFDIVFDCKPQRFLTSGETVQTFTADGTISNPTLFPSSPMLTITGTGTVGIGTYSMTITGSVGQVIYIDCEVMEAWTLSGGVKVNANDKVQYAGNTFPVLVPGSNGVDLGTGITKVEITPRWWKL